MGRDAVVLLLLEIENNCSTNKKIRVAWVSETAFLKP